ncbi:hypothetical protein RchiOBHm_Chr3g0490731 [Rosa chinensis]|uniref:Uncharacterized protein n=1 Tax=Rosa chinensis TaxID=74649 RepID=A0A2P6RG28_ROSCH|nr:hypothetical protein RchiOBHm_Chr3g0490731 [Rosa chinensis]
MTASSVKEFFPSSLVCLRNASYYGWSSSLLFDVYENIPNYF